MDDFGVVIIVGTVCTLLAYLLARSSHPPTSSNATFSSSQWTGGDTTFFTTSASVVEAFQCVLQHIQNTQLQVNQIDQTLYRVVLEAPTQFGDYGNWVTIQVVPAKGNPTGSQVLVTSKQKFGPIDTSVHLRHNAANGVYSILLMKGYATSEIVN